MLPNDSCQAQPPERDVACKDDVRVSTIGQLPGAAAVANSGLLNGVGLRLTVLIGAAL